MPFSTTEQAEIKSVVAEFIANELNKKRIPELLPYTQYGDLSVNDLLALWMAGTNKTVHVPIGALTEFINTGGTGTLEPVLKGDTIIHVVTAAEAGGYKIYEPSIAGMNFFLREEGRPVQPSEFNVLAAGGAELVRYDTDSNRIPLYEGQRFDLQVYELSGGTPGEPDTTTAGFLTSIVEAAINTVLTVEQVNSLVQLRGGNTSITATLPDAAAVTDRSYFVFEASVNSNRENVINTTGGQYIYIGGTAYTSINIRPGESVILVKAGSAWHDISNFSEILRQVANIELKHYTNNQNELTANGAIVSKIEYARLWAKISGIATTYTDWNVNKGKYCDYSATEFILPDLTGMVLKGATASRGAGTYEADQMPEHDHAQAIGQDGPQTALGYVMDSNNLGTEPISQDIRTGKAGTGTETRVKTMGIVYVIKA